MNLPLTIIIWMLCISAKLTVALGDFPTAKIVDFSGRTPPEFQVCRLNQKICRWPIRNNNATTSMPIREIRSIRQVAIRHKLSAHETALLLAIRQAEQGRAGIEYGIGQDRLNHPARRFAKYPMRSLVEQATWAARLIRDYYDGDLHRFARQYCPYNAEAWTRNVRYWWRKYYREN